MMLNKQYNIKYKIILTILFLSISSYILYIYNPFQSIAVDHERSLFTTNNVRMNIVQKYCKKTQYLITSEQRSTYQEYNNNIATYLKANATYLFPAAKNGQWGNVFRQLQVNGVGTFVFIAPFIIGLLLFILAIPCITCCCCCPQTCPPPCCRSKNQHYSNGELLCPTIFVILLTFTIIATSIPLMTNSGSYFQDFNCLSSKFVDNFANGNTTSSQLTFFSGVKKIRTQLKDVLMPKISDVAAQISKIQASASALSTAITNTNNALNSMKSMPKGGTDFTQFTLSYTTPLTQSTTTGSLATLIGKQIGTFGNTSTLLGSFYDYIFVNIYTNLTTITAAASNVHPKLVPSEIGVAITAADAILSIVQNNINDLADNFISPAQNLLANLDSYNIKYSMYFYGLIIGISVGVLAGVIFLKCFNMIKFRFCLYFLCIVLFLICLVAFIVTIILSFTLPSLYYTCQYLQDTFTTPAKWTSTILTLNGNGYTETANHFAQCFGGTNDFITFVNPTLSSHISNLKTSVFNSKQYDFSFMTTQVNSKILAMKSLIDSVGQGNIPDFDISGILGASQIDKFNAIANKTLFNTDCPSSSFNIFYQDVWVPGVSSAYQTYVSCINKISINSTTCGVNIHNYTICPFSRCINAFSIISQYYRTGNIGNIASNSNTRYGTCAPFNSYVANFHIKYVKPIVDNIGNSASDAAASAKLAGRFVINTKTPVQNLRDYMNNNIQPIFNEVYNNLTTTHGLQSVFNIDTGVLKGMDCGVLGESGNSMKQSLCITSFNKIYLSFVCLAIISIGTFIQICCLVCFNVRHYMKSKESEFHTFKQPRMHRIHPHEDTNVDIKMMS